MKLKFLAVLSFALVLALSGPAFADKGGKGKGHAPAAETAHENGHESNDDDTIFGFNDKEAAVIVGVLRSLYGSDDKEVEIVRPSREFCPPGLAKKHNGCMPPGQAKKYKIGERLPDDVVAGDLPDVLRNALGLPPKGKRYVKVDNDVLLIQEGTRLVLDAIGVGNH